MFSTIHSILTLAAAKTAEVTSPAAKVVTGAARRVASSPPGQGAPQQPQAPCGGRDMFTGFFIPLIIVFVIMYIFIISPQRKKEKHRREMLDSLGKGDNAVTIGGIHGTVWQVKDEEIVLKIDGDIKMTFSRGAIARVVKKEESGSDTAGS